jgi:hypothetical protein
MNTKEEVLLDIDAMCREVIDIDGKLSNLHGDDYWFALFRLKSVSVQLALLSLGLENT